MKQLRSILLSAMMLLIIGQLFAGGFALSGVGSKATALGGAFRALADDGSAMYWNPAGLAFQDENSVSLGGTFILPSATWEPTAAYATANPGYEAKEYEAEKSLRAFPNLLVTMAKNERIKYGLGVFVPYGLGTTWSAYELPGAPFVYADGFPENDMLSSIQIIDIHPTVAYRIMDNLSVGAGVSVFYGNIRIAQIAINPAMPYVPNTFDMEGDGIGFGANLGLMYQPLDRLSIGLSGKIPSNIPLKGDAEVFAWKPWEADDNPEMKLGGKEDIKATLRLPGEIGLGLAYQLTDDFTLVADYSYTMWERLDEVKVEMDKPINIMPGVSVEEQALVFDWENTHRVSLGGEYDLFANKLRMGFFFDQTPVPEETQLPTLSDISNKLSGNIGWGRDFGNIGVEANVQMVLFSEREIGDGAQTANNRPGTYNTNSLSGNIGLNYRF
ncbi:MAG: OmpP1/FadL family transporter [Candidatus Cloacimonadaceae bacterium]